MQLFQLDDYDEPVVTRYMSVVQFWTLRSDILKRVGKKYGKDDENQFEFVNSSGDIIDKDEVDQTPQVDVEVSFFLLFCHTISPV